MSEQTIPPLPEPPPYLRAIAEHLRVEEPGLWAWFASSARRQDEAEAVRLDLLKSTYRLEPAEHAALYAVAEELRAELGITALLTLYQGAATGGVNAALAYLPGEAHVILSGPVVSALDAAELRAVLAHELAHYLLLDGYGGDYRILTDLVRALANAAGAGLEYAETARLVSLYTEVFADRWALRATGQIGAAVRTLVKVQTGVAEVSAESYLRQAAEIFAKGPVLADQPTHPEIYIRARALELWAGQGAAAEDEIASMIAGPLRLERLDLLAQGRLRELSRQFLAVLLTPAWFRTDAVMGHARQFFPGFEPGGADEGALARAFDSATASVRDYFSFVLLDFVTVDRDLGDAALAAALVLAGRLGFGERFAELLHKELGMTKKAVARLDGEAQKILERAAVA